MTKVMLLAAGRGQRLRPLTDKLSKVLIEINDKPLIEYHIERCVQAGFKEFVINLAYKGQQVKQRLGDGSRWGVDIAYAQEPEGALETGGGLINALPLLGEKPFICINADIFTDYNFANLKLNPEHKAHLILVKNPKHNLKGDFSVDNSGLVTRNNPSHTYSGIACYHPDFFNQAAPGRFSVVSMLLEHAEKQLLGGEVYHGSWFDVGTKERLEEVRTFASMSAAHN